MIKAAFFVDYGRDIGVGHLVRCEAIADYLEDCGVSSFFFLDYSEKLFYIPRYSFETRLWRDGLFVEKLSGKFDIAIVDSYLINEDILDAFINNFKLVVVIDDKGQWINLKDVLLVNFSLGFHHRYLGQRDNLLIGNKYIPLRKCLVEYALRNEFKRKKNLVLVLLGGTDVAFLTKKVVDVCKGFGLDMVVVTASEQVANDIGRMESAKSLTLELRPPCERLAYLFMSCGFAISAGGMTMYELAFFSVPTIALCVADNQSWGLNQFVKLGFIEEFLKREDPHFDVKLASLVNFYINNYDTVCRMAAVGRRIVDGRGGYRLARRIVDSYNEKIAHSGRKP